MLPKIISRLHFHGAAKHCRNNIAVSHTVSRNHQQRGLVVLCGWLGAKEAHLSKYDGMVREAPCNVQNDDGSIVEAQLGGTRVLSFIAPAIMLLKSEQSIETFYCTLADRILRQTRVLAIKTGSAEPLVFYALSGNGAISLGLLLKALRTQLGESRHARMNPPIVSGVIYDSAPCFIDTPLLARGYLGLATARVLRRPQYQHPLATPVFEAFFNALMRCWPSRRKLLDDSLNELLHAGLSQPLIEDREAAAAVAPPRQLVLISEGDTLVLCKDVRSFFAKQHDFALQHGRASTLGVRSLDFGPDSEHVGHFRHQPKRYVEEVHRLLQKTHSSQWHEDLSNVE